MQKAKTKRGRSGDEGKVRCRIDLSPEVAAKLYWLAKVNKVGFPDGIAELMELKERGDLIFEPKKVGAPRRGKRNESKGGNRVR